MQAIGYDYSPEWLDATLNRMLSGLPVLTSQHLQDNGIASGWNEAEAAILADLLRARIEHRHLILSTRPLQHPTLGMTTCENGTPEQLTADTVTPAIVTPARPIVPRIQVNVRQEYVGSWLISCKVNDQRMDVPRTATVKPFLPREYRAKLAKSRNHYASQTAYNNALSSGAIPAQVLADAIKAHFAATLNLQTDATATASEQEENSSLMRMQPATLLAGGVAYRLVPVGGTDLRNPLKGIRQRAREVATREAATLREAANADSARIVRTAEERAATIRRDIQREQERARLQTQAPAWLMEAGRPFYRNLDNRGYWTVIMKVPTALEYVEMAVSQWNKTLYWDAVPISERNMVYGSKYLLVRVSMGASGEYDMNSCVTWGGWEAPHINERACMTLQGLPARLDSVDSLQRLEQALGRGNRVINMNSLLSRSIKRWHPWIVAQLPEAIKSMMLTPQTHPQPRETVRDEESWPANLRNWNRAVEYAETVGQVFHVPA